MNSLLISNSFILNLQQRGDQIALYSQQKEITNEELYQQSLQLALSLRKRNACSDDRAIIASKPGVQFLQTIYATMMLDMMVSIIDPHMGRENYKKKLEQFNPNWAFVDSRLLLLQEHPILRKLYLQFSNKGIYIPIQKNVKYVATGPRLPLVRSFNNQVTHIKKLVKGVPQAHEFAEKVDSFDYLVTYTSGTTDEPKGVLHSLEGLEVSIKHIIALLGDPSSQKTATHLPHFMLIGVTAGIPVYIWEEKWSIKRKLEYIEKHKITTLFGPPAEFQEMIDYLDTLGAKIPSCIRHIILGSAPIYRSFLVKFLEYISPTTRITCMYGMTENLIVSYVDGREKMNTEIVGDLLGKPVNGVQLKISEEGEILLKSDQLFRRYLHQDARLDWHETGDLGRISEHGIVMTGRKKNMIIRRNFNIYPALYEPIIESIPEIKNATMIGIYSESISDEIVYLVCSANSPTNSKTILNSLRVGPYSIDHDALPDKIIFVENLPRSGRQQKVDYEAIRELITNSESSDFTINRYANH